MTEPDETTPAGRPATPDEIRRVLTDMQNFMQRQREVLNTGADLLHHWMLREIDPASSPMSKQDLIRQTKTYMEGYVGLQDANEEAAGGSREGPGGVPTTPKLVRPANGTPMSIADAEDALWGAGTVLNGLMLRTGDTTALAWLRKVYPDLVRQYEN